MAFTTEIAEPDKDGGALRYRGVDIEELVNRQVTFGDVWALLVDGRFGHGLPPAEPFPLPIHSGDVRVDVQAGLPMLAPIWGYPPLLDIDDATARDQLARASVMALSYVAQSARGIYQPAVPQRTDRRMLHRDSAFHDPLAGRAGPQARRGDRRLLGIGRRARPERLHVHRQGDRVDRRRRGGGAVRRHRRDERPAARRRARTGDPDDRRGRAHRRRAGGGPRRAGPQGEADGLRSPRVPRGGSAGPGVARHGQETGGAALRGRRRARAGRADRTARASPRPRHRNQRRVLGGGDPGLRRGARQDDACDVHLRPHRGLVRAHPRTEAARQTRPPVGDLRRPRTRAARNPSRAGTRSRGASGDGGRPPRSSRRREASPAWFTESPATAGTDRDSGNGIFGRWSGTRPAR